LTKEDSWDEVSAALALYIPNAHKSYFFDIPITSFTKQQLYAMVVMYAERVMRDDI
jgi:hypothetical protein